MTANSVNTPCTQVTSDANTSNHAGHEKFSEVIDNLRLQIPSEQPIDYSALRDYGKRNRLDYAAFFQPPQGGFRNCWFPTLSPF